MKSIYIVIVLLVCVIGLLFAQTGSGTFATPQPAKQAPTVRSDNSGIITDPRDNKKYRTVRIGNLTWMAENLNYQTGNSICYGDHNANCTKYGRLYDWETAMKACPTGWRLPNNADWNALVNTVNGDANKLKSRTGWKDGFQSQSGIRFSGNGIDEYGFSALPGGYYDSSYFIDIGEYGYWWSATGYDSSHAHNVSMAYKFVNVSRDSTDKNFGFSVRCVQNRRAQMF